MKGGKTEGVACRGGAKPREPGGHRHRENAGRGITRNARIQVREVYRREKPFRRDPRASAKFGGKASCPMPGGKRRETNEPDDRARCHKRDHTR